MQALHGQAVRACWAATCGRRAPAGGVQTQPVCRRSRCADAAGLRTRGQAPMCTAGTRVGERALVRRCGAHAQYAPARLGRSTLMWPVHRSVGHLRVWWTHLTSQRGVYAGRRVQLSSICTHTCAGASVRSARSAAVAEQAVEKARMAEGERESHMYMSVSGCE